MATVFERFKKLGLATSNPVLMKVGCHVATSFHNDTIEHYLEIRRKEQNEDGQFYIVNDYPDEWVPKMDKIIISMIEKGIQNA